MRLQSLFKGLTASLLGLSLGLSATVASAQDIAPRRGFLGGAAPSLGKLDPDTGPTFIINGTAFANQRAFIESGGRCATRNHTEMDVLRDQAASKARFGALGPAQARPVGSVTVPVWVHVINKGAGIANGDVPQSWVTSQIQILNDAWAATAFRFQLAGTTRTTNAAWYDMANETAELAAKSALKRGGTETLNIYVADLSGGTLLGYAYYPSDAAAVGVLDGVVLLNQSLPGGNASPYNLGDTGTHEVGHWFGLAHTFEGACGRVNDQVGDTAPEASPAFGCPVGRNTCRAARTGDPITNFMDYTDDACMNKFSNGQFARMDTQHLLYRTPAPTRTASN